MTNSPNSPEYGTSVTLMPGLTRIIAPNPSPMTYWGTNTYIVGGDDVVVIDPGPDEPAHLSALLTALAGRRVVHILVTHSHVDHSALCTRLAAHTGANVLAFGESLAGRSAVMKNLVKQGLTTGGEGVDHGFQPDVRLADGAIIAGGWGDISAIHTPGHMANHMCFAWQDQIFTGDHIMGWASSLISPPDGDVTAFMQSCDRLRGFQAMQYLPGHGAPIEHPTARLDWIVQHRHDREAQIRAALNAGHSTIGALTDSIYHDLDILLRPAAQRNVFAHLIDLSGRGQVKATPGLGFHAKYEILDPFKK